MPTYNRFEDLPAWNAATDLAVSVFKLTAHPEFRYKGDLVNQLRRAALSVANNIAEGFERGTTNELISFLYVARGSAGEVRSMLRFALRLGEMPESAPRVEALVPACESVSRQLRAWLDTLQNSDVKGQRHLNDQSRRAYEEDRRAAETERILAARRAMMERQLRDGTYGTPDAEPLPDAFSLEGRLAFLREERAQKEREKAAGRKSSRAPDASSSTSVAPPASSFSAPPADSPAAFPPAAPAPAPSCPKCGRPMVRRASRDGASFWGCSGYPQCRGTRRI